MSAAGACSRQRSKITGLACSTINRGRGTAAARAGARAAGGRKAVSEKDPGGAPALQRLVEPVSAG
jgi:hypothetical protein